MRDKPINVDSIFLAPMNSENVLIRCRSVLFFPDLVYRTNIRLLNIITLRPVGRAVTRLSLMGGEV